MGARLVFVLCSILCQCYGAPYPGEQDSFMFDFYHLLYNKLRHQQDSQDHLVNPQKCVSSGLVFGIGFHKTGTTTLGGVLSAFGYKVTEFFDFKHSEFPNGISSDRVLEEAVSIIRRGYTATEDIPWPFLYKELDNLYPCSKFVLTFRTVNSWLESTSAYFFDQRTVMFDWMYKWPQSGGFLNKGNWPYLRRLWFDFHTGVVEYFKDRPQDIFYVEWSHDHTFNNIATFLNKPIPAVPFPKSRSRKCRTKSDFFEVTLSEQLAPWGGTAPSCVDYQSPYVFSITELGQYVPGVKSLFDRLRPGYFFCVSCIDLTRDCLLEHAVSILRELRSDQGGSSPKYYGGMSTPWPVLWKELDQLFPCSRFFMLNMSETVIRRQVLNNYMSQTNIRAFLYNQTAGDTLAEQQEKWLHAAVSNNRNALAYFQSVGAGDRIKVVDINANTRWQELTDWAGISKPKRFPEYVDWWAKI